MKLQYIDNISKLLINNYFSLPKIKQVNVSIYIKNIKKLRIFLILQAFCCLDIICSKKPIMYSYKVNYDYKQRRFNFYSKVSLTRRLMNEFLKLYKFYLLSELKLNYISINMYDSFSIKKLTIIPYIDELYYKTNYSIKTNFVFNPNLNIDNDYFLKNYELLCVII